MNFQFRKNQRMESSYGVEEALAMSNLMKALGDEIRRLARKEIRTQISVTKQALNRQRKEIASLKKAVASQKQQIEHLQRKDAKTSLIQDQDESSVEHARFSPRSVKSHRKRLKLSAEDYAKLVGVSMQTIYHWEQGKSRPRKSQMAAIIAVRKLGRKEAVRRLEDANATTNGHQR